MATQTVEFRAATGLTITAKLFSAGSDTEVASVSATEATNRKGTYSAAYTDVAAGEYVLIALSSGTPVASWWVSLTLSTATFQVYERVDKAGIADSVWDEPYAQHTTAGSFGKLLDTVRKSNLTIDGVVSNAITPTTLTFASDVSATTSAYAHAVLLFVTGPLAGENSPIISYTSTNGVFVLEEPLTAAPSNGDEFVVIAGSHVHSVADIQDGLALEATVQALDLSVTVTPLSAGDVQRVEGTTIEAFVGELSDISTSVSDANGDPVDLSTTTLRIYIQNPTDSEVVQTIEDADITVSGGDSDTFTFTPDLEVVETRRKLLWSLRDVDDGEKVLARGVLDIQTAAWSE